MRLNIQKNIFEIILKKFLFQKCPQEQKDIDEFFKQIADENNPFIKNYFYIIENKKNIYSRNVEWNRKF